MIRETDRAPDAPSPSAPKAARRKVRSAADGSPSLADVARTANVSTASASRALARPELVSEAVRVRVSAAASRLGYVPNAAARSLATRRSALVGAVLGDSADPVTLQMLEAAERSLSAHGIGIVVRFACETTPAAECAKSLAERGVDALLFIGAGALPDPDGWKPGRATPYVECGQAPGSDVEGLSEPLERRSIALACAYLQQLGHRRIGVVGPRRGEGAAQRTSTSEKLTLTEERVDELRDTEALRAAVRRLIENAATGIVTSSDIAAAAALRECRALGLAVPGQISVIGCGDTALARCLDPPLTSIRVAASASGQAAAEHLAAVLAGGSFAWPDLPLKLVIRESAAEAPS
ncbi:MAG TPA: LacI family DNA-binding transcriptional regulator [Casimicrobiaceae bacterium]|nr:LacI family DNA-binding transcriptional regulator [Casimicrobiaceae bacterium]